MWYRLLFVLLHLSITCICGAGQGFSQEQKQQATAANPPQSTLVNINNISMWIREDGWSGRNPETGDGGIVFPRGTVPVVFQDGIVWGGMVQDGQTPELRVHGHTYNTGMASGRIISKGVPEDRRDPDVRIWRIREDWRTADLTRDAAEFFNTSLDSVTDGQIAAVRAQYEKDWKEWPWQKGAPFYDDNNNGIMDAGEKPGLANADQVVWFVANDIAAYEAAFAGSPTVGFEYQVTLWAYKHSMFENVIFKKYRLIYKGKRETPDDARIENMFIGQWTDPDLGFSHDNYAGCDSALQIGFAYNGPPKDRKFSKFDTPPPAIGYILLQGPTVVAEEKNTSLPLHAFWWYGEGIDCSRLPSPLGSYEYAIELWNMFKGSPVCPPEHPVTWSPPPQPFKYCGDPVRLRGEFDARENPPGYRQFAVSTGPFTMALGDTQDVVFALVGGLGSHHIASVAAMKYNAKLARDLARHNFDLPPEPDQESQEPPLPKHFRLSQNFPNPFNPSTEIRFELPVERRVTLTVYNTLGQKVKTLVDEVREAGSHSVTWDGTNERGQPVPSGVYFYRFDAGVVTGTKKMLLLR